jgi:Tfp pilus assembly protein PilP
MRFRWTAVIAVLMLAVFGLTACGGGVDEAAEQKRLEAEAKLAEMRAKAAKPAATRQAKTTEIKMPTAQEVLDEVGLSYTYDPINKPDPFRAYAPASDLSMHITGDNPLLKYEVRYFQLVGIIKDTELPLAIFEDPSGKSYTVKVGDAIGKNGGVVRSILDDAVVVTETRISWRTEGTETIEIVIRLRTDSEA